MLFKIPRPITNLMRKSFSLMPKFIRQNRFINKLIIRIFLGSSIDIDWKKNFKKTSNAEWIKAYDEGNLVDIRGDDTSAKQKQQIVKNSKGKTVLEVGVGSGATTLILTKAGFDVTAVDCSTVALKKTKERFSQKGLKIKTVQAFLEELPFKNKSFDTIVCAHTLEHVKDLKKSVKELKRVARKRLIIVVPEQEYSEYTTDLHTQFFPTKKALIGTISTAGIAGYKCRHIDSDIFYVGNIK